MVFLVHTALFSIQVPIFYTGTSFLYRYQFSIQVPIFYTGTNFLYRYQFSIQVPIFYTCTNFLYRYQFSIQVPILRRIVFLCLQTVNAIRSDHSSITELKTTPILKTLVPVNHTAAFYIPKWLNLSTFGIANFRLLLIDISWIVKRLSAFQVELCCLYMVIQSFEKLG